jgi:hypothetical protein
MYGEKTIETIMPETHASSVLNQLGSYEETAGHAIHAYTLDVLLNPNITHIPYMIAMIAYALPKMGKLKAKADEYQKKQLKIAGKEDEFQSLDSRYKRESTEKDSKDKDTKA